MHCCVCVLLCTFIKHRAPSHSSGERNHNGSLRTCNDTTTSSAFPFLPMPALLVGGEGSEPLWTAPDPFPGTKIILSLQLPLQLFTEKQKSPPQYKPVPRNSHSPIAWAKKVGRKPTVGKDLYCQGKLSLHKWDRTEQVCKAHFTWTTWHRKHKDWKEKYSFHFSCWKPRLASNLKCAPSASPVLGPQVPVTMPRV